MRAFMQLFFNAELYKSRFTLSRNFYVRTPVNFTRVNKIEAMYEKVARKRKTWIKVDFHWQVFFTGVSTYILRAYIK